MAMPLMFTQRGTAPFSSHPGRLPNTIESCIVACRVHNRGDSSRTMQTGMHLDSAAVATASIARDGRQRHDGESKMKKLYLTVIGIAALGLATPASAADLAARPYKAPPPV